MSIRTTHKVTREFAILAIQVKMATLPLRSDEELADILEEVLHNGFYNFQVMSQEEFDEDEKHEYPTPSLTDIQDLPEENDAW